MHSLQKNGTWKLTLLPKWKKTIGCKWIFVKKEGFTGKNDVRYKARLIDKVVTKAKFKHCLDLVNILRV